MFDTHNAVNETEPHPALIERYFEFIRHVHVNELDGRHPGCADYDFGTLLATLIRLGYRHWVSLEVFDFKPGADGDRSRVPRSSKTSGPNEINNMTGKYVVTGGAGFIGSALVRRLLKEGAEVAVIDSLLTGHERNLAEVRDRISFHKADIRDFRRDCRDYSGR